MLYDPSISRVPFKIYKSTSVLWQKVFFCTNACLLSNYTIAFTILNIFSLIVVY